MASDKISGRERQPMPGAAKSLLNTVKLPDNSKPIKDPKTQDVINKVVKCFEDSARYDKEIANAQSTATVEQVRTLLNQLNVKQLQPAIEEIKDEVSSLSLKNIISDMLMNQVNQALDNIQKSNIDELKAWAQDAFGKQAEDKHETINEESGDVDQLDVDQLDVDQLSEQISQMQDDIKKSDKQNEDESVGEYQDSLSAKNFQVLQDFVNNQFDSLNIKLKNIPGQSGILSRISESLSNGFSSVIGGIGSIAGKTVGLFASVGKISEGIKNFGSSIGSIIATPFKRIGGFFSAMNPFHKSDERNKERKKSVKERIFNVMSNILEKIWNAIEPFIGKVSFFMGLVTKLVITPIAIIAAKVLLVTAAIVALGIAAYIAYKWIKDKISSFWKYITSGKMWKDLKTKLLEWWNWLKDFGKWLWDITIKALKYIFVGMWVDLGKWLWEQLCKFGNWLYDKFIRPYIVEPIKKVIGIIQGIWEEKIQPIVQPFIDSLMNLYNKIKQAFAQWDTNKSIWENLKNISGIIVDSVKEWWENSPFKEFYDKHLDPIVKSLANLIDRIKTIWQNFKWDENKSFIENMKGIASTIKDGVIEWWTSADNPIRAAYNEHIKPMIDKIKDVVAPIVEKIKEVWNSLKVKMGNIVLKVPFFGFVRPFGPMAGLPFKLSESESDDYEKFGKRLSEIDKENEKDDKRLKEIDEKIKNKDFGWFENEEKLRHERATIMQRQKRNAKEKIRLEHEAGQKQQQIQMKELTKQQIGQAMQPLESIGKMKSENTMQLSQHGQEMSQQMQKKEEKQQKDDQQMKQQLAYMCKKIDKVDADNEKNAHDPIVAPLPYYSGNMSMPSKNSATMQSPYASSMINAF